MSNAGDTIAVMAQRMWTSALQLRGREFCFILNYFLREDSPTLAGTLGKIARAINQLCVTANRATAAVHPPDFVCYRGAGFDDACVLRSIQSASLTVCVCVCLSVSLSLSLCVSLCLTLPVSLSHSVSLRTVTRPAPPPPPPSVAVCESVCIARLTRTLLSLPHGCGSGSLPAPSWPSGGTPSGRPALIAGPVSSSSAFAIFGASTCSEQRPLSVWAE